MKIAIVTRQMITGGVERALIGMLGAMNSHDEVDLYVERLGGELFEELPDWINIIEIPRKSSDVSIKSLLEKVRSVKSRLELWFCKEYIKQCELSARSFPIIEKEYDMAITYHAPNTIPVFYVIHNLKAKKKVMWLHGDVETNHMTGEFAKSYYQQYDKFFAVSKQSKEIFIKHFPELSYRCEVFYNIIDVDYLKRQAENAPTYTDDFKGIRILTIGRLDYQKGIDLAVETCKKLLDEGISVRWYVCGEGSERKNIEAMISKYNIQENFRLLGNQKNPYGYLKACDIYVQPSRTEGFCTTTNEAKCFKKPIVATDVCGMREQFAHGESGILCEISTDKLFESIRSLVQQPEERFKLSENIRSDKKRNYIHQIYQVVNQV